MARFLDIADYVSVILLVPSKFFDAGSSVYSRSSEDPFLLLGIIEVLKELLFVWVSFVDT